MRARASMPGVLGALGALAALAGCSAILGVPDLAYDPSGPGGGGADAGADGGGDPTDGGGADGSLDGAACNADLQKDQKNCGRCGRDCVGGACVGGACEPVTVAQGLDQPTGLAVDATHVYFATLGDGAVARVPKGGSTVEALATTSSPIGVAVDGPTLYWGSFSGSGGVSRCTITSCASTITKLSSTGYVRFVRSAGGAVFFTTESDVRRMQPDGGAEAVIGTATQPYDLSVDATHVYFTSLLTQLQRVQVDGGGQVGVGPLVAPTNLATVTNDAERFYWTYIDDATKKGVVLSGQKASPATRVAYGANHEGTVGVAVDDTNVYFANGGTFTGSAANGDGALLYCPKAGCGGAPVALAKSLAGAGEIAQDAQAVYWVEYGAGAAAAGRIRKVAKP